jgi:thiosulfate/3-mercaptopyruvate sulfurtransferase
VKIDWKADLQDPVRRDFVNQEQFSKLLSEKGISNDDTVVLYGGNNNWFAAYAYWYFKLYGHGDVKLLDGGRKKWELDARPVLQGRADRAETQLPGLRAGPVDPRVPRRGRQAIGVKNLVDVRSPDEFAGRLLAPAHLPQEQSQRAGHIPTAISVPWSKAANEDGTFKSDDELGQDLRRGRPRRQQGHHRVLPDRRALLAHLVRAQGAARPAEREELRRLLDRVRLAHRRADRARRRARKGVTMTSPSNSRTAAPPRPVGSHPGQRRPREGNRDHRRRDQRRGEAVGGAYVRLLDSTGEFAAEVVTSPQGVFRFFAAPGVWTLRALSRHGNGDQKVDVDRGLNEVRVTVAP